MFVFHPNKKILFDWCSGVTEKVESLNKGQSNCPLQNTSDSPFKTQTQHFKSFSKHKHFPSNHHFLLQGTWLSNLALAQQTLFTQARQHWFALAVKVFVIIVHISADFSYVSLYPLFTSYHQRWHALAVEVFVIIVLISADFSFVSLSSLLVVSPALIFFGVSVLSNNILTAQRHRGVVDKRQKDVSWKEMVEVITALCLVIGQCWWQLQNINTDRNSRFWTIEARRSWLQELRQKLKTQKDKKTMPGRRSDQRPVWPVRW